MVNNLYEKKSLGRINIDIFICLLITLSILTIYVKIGTHDFTIIDDNVYVCNNDHVTSGLTKENIKWAFGFTAEKTYWHPLSWLSHMLDCHLFGLEAGKHHMVNVFFHILNSILLFVVLKMMTGARWKSSFVAFLFALHPLNVDSVAWIAERKNLLSSFFWMLSMISYVYYSKKPHFTRYIITLFIFSIGLLAKPMLVTLPCVFLLLDYWPLKRIDNNYALSPGNCPQVSLSCSLFEKIPFLVVSFFAISVAIFSMKSIKAVVSSDTVPMTLRITNAIVSYIQYLYKMILPINLAIYYPFPNSIPAWQIIGSIVLLLLITILAIKHIKSKPYIALGWFWFLGTLVPVIGLIQGGLWPALADRWAYIPLIGIFISITWGSAEIWKKLKYNKFFFIIPGTLILIIFALISKKQLSYWKDDLSLLMHTKKATAENATINFFLGCLLKEQGKIDQAIDCFREALRLNPKHAVCHVFLGNLLSEKGDKSKAFDHFSIAVLLKPDDFNAQCSFAAYFVDKGDTESAIKHYLHALKLRPDSEKVLINLGNINLSSGKIEKARDYYKKTLQLNPHIAKAYYHLGIIANKMGDSSEVIKNYETALKIDAEFVEAHNNLAVFLFNNGQIQNSMYHFREALRIDPNNQSAHNKIKAINNSAMMKKISNNIIKLRTALKNSPGDPALNYKLGTMYFKQGDYLKAITEYQKAVDIKADFIDAIANMATLYVLTNKYNEAIIQYRKLITLQPENDTIYYNISCVFAKKGNIEEAVNYLKKATEKGYNDWEYLKQDSDLEIIRDTDYFKKLTSKINR